MSAKTVLAFAISRASGDDGDSSRAAGVIEPVVIIVSLRGPRSADILIFEAILIFFKLDLGYGYFFYLSALFIIVYISEFIF